MASLNPLKLIDELITEHGSAAIQGKHITFLKDQLLTLKEQFVLLERETTNLRTRNAQLEAEVAKLKSKTEKRPDVGTGGAPILEALHAHGPELTVESICERTNIDRDDVEHIWADHLDERGFVTLLKYPDGRLESMTILPEGRAAWVRHRNVMKILQG